MDDGQYTNFVGKEATVTLRAGASRSYDPWPIADPNAVIAPNENGGAVVDIAIAHVWGGGTPVVVEVRDPGGNAAQTLQGQTDTSGNARVIIPDGQLPTGGYTVHVSSPGDALNSPFPAAQIGKLRIMFKPTVSGTNALAALPSAYAELGFAAQLSGSDPDSPISLTLTLGANAKAVTQQGDAALQLRCVMDPSSTGELPVTVTAPATSTSEAIPETRIGTVTVLDKSAVLGGELASKLDGGWTLVSIAPGAWLAARGDGWTVDGEGNQTALAGEALDIATGWTAKAAPTGYLSRIGMSAFGVKAVQRCPPSWS